MTLDQWMYALWGVKTEIGSDFILFSEECFFVILFLT